MGHDREPADVAIVGGGASGTILAIHLLRKERADGPVVLVERRNAYGLGVAYSTEEPAHLLNVPAGGMSALHDEPDHFLEWLHDARIPAGYGVFVPRATYGRYLGATLEAAERISLRSLIRIRGSVEDVQTGRNGAVVEGRSLPSVRARRVVLALGNPPPGTPPFLGSPMGERYIRDPWKAVALRRVGPDEPVLLVGTGLTAVDVALALTAGGHRGPLHAVSRHGLLPQVHRLPAERTRPLRTLRPFPSPLSVRRLLRWAREEVRAAEADGADWRDVMRSVRPWTQRLWMQLSHEERGIFLRHLQRHWSVHRHRMAPEIARAVAAMRASGQLSVHAGKVAVQERDGKFDVAITPHLGSSRHLTSSWVVNCTGPDLDPRRSQEPLVRSLLERGDVRPDPLGLGFECTPEGAMVDSTGTAGGTLWAIGPPRTGSLWESTAVPEIREQASKLSDALGPVHADAPQGR